LSEAAWRRASAFAVPLLLSTPQNSSSSITSPPRSSPHRLSGTRTLPRAKGTVQAGSCAPHIAAWRFPLATCRWCRVESNRRFRPWWWVGLVSLDTSPQPPPFILRHPLAVGNFHVPALSVRPLQN